MLGKKGDIFNFSIKFIDYEHDYIHDHRGVVKTLRTLKKVLKWWGKKRDILKFGRESIDYDHDHDHGG